MSVLLLLAESQAMISACVNKMNLASTSWSISRLMPSMQGRMLSGIEPDIRTGVDALHWQNAIVFSAKTRKTERSNWKHVLLAVVCFLHAAMIANGYYWQKDFQKSRFTDDEALQVSFIDRVAIPDAKPSYSPASEKKRIVTTRSSKSPEETSDQNLFVEDPDISERQTLRLTMDIDEWKQAEVVAPRNPLKRQYIALAGRVEPFIHGIKISDKATPQQRLQLLGKLFGAVEYDPCKEARNRMASGQSLENAIDLEHDLQAIEHHCRP